MNRTDFQQLADIRIDEAATLLDQGKPSGAYYLAGYAIECALKACIAKLTNQYDFPPGKQIVNDCYTHNLEKLVVSAQLKAQLEADCNADPNLKAMWSTVTDWTEESRYKQMQATQAKGLIDAVMEPNHGVLTWVKKHW